MMKTDFYNTNGGIMMSGDTINQVFIYSDGVILATLDEITEKNFDTDKKGFITRVNGDVYDGTPEKIIIKGETKKAIKLNLHRKDNFFIKNPDKKYSIDAPYNYYINISSLDNFYLVGDVLAADFNHEKNYLETYRITFPGVVFRRCKFEKIPCENYTLKDGEQFSSCYGVDKNHPCIDTYEITKDAIFTLKKHPEKLGEKGIIKRWREYETNNNYTMVLTKRCYTKCVKDEYRLNAEKIAEKLNNIFKYNIGRFSYYEIEKLLENGINITFNN